MCWQKNEMIDLLNYLLASIVAFHAVQIQTVQHADVEKARKILVEESALTVPKV